MKTFAVLFYGLMLTVTLAASQVSAQEHRHEPQDSRSNPADKPSGHGSMHAMHQECMQRHHAAMTAVDQVTSLMESAKASDDPAKLKAAINEAHKQLTQVKDSMATCKQMMTMMEKMHGGMMKDGHK